MKTVNSGSHVIVTGIYRSSGCSHPVERTLHKGHLAPQCEQCRHSITWVLVRATLAA